MINQHSMFLLGFFRFSRGKKGKGAKRGGEERKGRSERKG